MPTFRRSQQDLPRTNAYLNAGGEISYWHTPVGVEIDFIWSRGDTTIAIELKSATRWQWQYSSVLRRSLEEKMVSRAFGVYLGPHVLCEGRVEILPLQEFLNRLWTGKILRSSIDPDP